MSAIETRITRLEQRLPEPDPFDELSHQELKALRDFLREEPSARELNREPSPEVRVALEVSGRDWGEWFARAMAFIKRKNADND